MKRVYIETYGCQMNVADSELMFGLLGRDGLRPRRRSGRGRRHAGQHLRGPRQRRAAGDRPHGRAPAPQAARATCSAWSAAWRSGSARRCSSAVPRVDLVVGPGRLSQPPGAASAAPSSGQRATDTEFPRLGALRGRPAGARKRHRPRSSRYSAAATTAAPSASSRTRAARSGAGGWRTSCARWPALAADGTTEVTLLGQTVNSYHDGAHDFADLLRAVGGDRAASAGCGSPVRIRPTSPRGSSRRWPPRRRCASTCTCRCRAARTRCSGGCCAATRASAISRWSASSVAAMPGITFSTDIIVGFPGETDAQFEETLSLVTDADFDDAYTFKYSVREGTPAVRLRDHVADEVASARLERLIEVVRANARRKNVARVGRRPRGAGGAAGPAGRSHAGPHPGQSSGPRSTCRSVPPGITTRCGSPARTGSTFTGAVVSAGAWCRRHWRSCDPQSGGRARHRGVQTAATTFPRFLRLRCLPGGCADFALNRVPPRYVSRREGSVVTEVALEKDQSRAAIEVAMMEGLRKISVAPRCGEPGRRGARLISGPPGEAAARHPPHCLPTGPVSRPAFCVF